MKTRNKFLLFAIILLMVGLTTVSATDVSTDTNSSNLETTTSSEINFDNSVVNTQSEISTVETSKISTNDMEANNIQKNNNNKNDLKSDEPLVQTITPSDYNQFFRYNTKKGNVETTELVAQGDILNLQGTFNGLNFTVDKSNVVLTSIGKKANLFNCTVMITGLTTGVQVKNLTINNSNEYGMGIFTNGTKKALIADNWVHVWGHYGFALAANYMNQSIISGNYFETSTRLGFEDADSEITQTVHTAAAFGNCYNNTIKNNTVVSKGANCIYFSPWGSGLFTGGACDNNIITNNTAIGKDTSWSYAIQAIGENNTITYNKVRNASRGISTQSYPGTVIMFNQVDATQQGIFTGKDSIVANNTVHVNGTTVGVEIAGDNSIVANNTIITQNGSGILIGNNYKNITITNNEITTVNGYGIYTKGQSKTITIANNTMNTGKEGILFKKQSTNKRPNYINITNNKITSLKSEYAIDLYECGARNPADGVISVSESNVISSANGIGLENAYLAPINVTEDKIPESHNKHTVTNKTYSTYFDTDGTVKSSKVLKNDTVVLTGTFHDVNFIFSSKVHIIGNNCIIYDGTIELNGDASASTITNVTIINKKEDSNNRNGIRIIEVNNCIVTNVKITNFDKWESFGILLYDSSGNKIANNYINTSGDYVNYGLFVNAGDMNTIENNTIYINQSNASYYYQDEIMFDDQLGTIKEVLNNYGIVLMYSSTNIVNNNTIKTDSMFKKYASVADDCKNSIVGIDIYFDSHNNKVTNNSITMTSYGPYTYGMGVLGAPWGTSITSLNATNNYFAYNKVKVSGGFFTTGFISGLNSINTTIDHNEFTVQSLHNTTSLGDYAYGLTLESSYNNTYTNNKLTAKGVAVYSIEIFESRNNTIKNNTIKATGTYPYGVAGLRASYNSVTNNNINITAGSHGSTVNQTYHTDAIPFGKSGVYLMGNSHDNNFTENYIHTNTDYSAIIEYNNVNNTIRNNSLLSLKGIGDKTVNNSMKINNVSNNFLYFTSLNITTESGKVGQPITLSAQVDSDTNNLENITATFRFGNTNVGQAKVNKGEVKIVYTVPKNWNSGNAYKLIISINGTNFQNTTETKNIKITKELIDTKITIPTVRGTPGSTVQIKANITDIYNNSVIGQATLKINGQNIETKNVTNGTITYNYKIPTNYQSKEYPITITFNQTKDYKASTATSTLGVQTKVIITTNPTTTTINNKTTLTATLTANGQAVTAGKVQITINNKTITNTTVNNGKITYTFTPQENTYGQHNYTLQYKYTGNNTLTDATTNTQLKIQKTNTKLTTTITPKTTTTGKQINITITITSTTNPQIKPNTGTIALKINEKIIKNTTTNKPLLLPITNGTAKLTFTTTNNLQPKNNLTIIYSGNHQLNPTTTTIKDAITIQQKLTTNKLTQTNTHYVTNGNYNTYFSNSGYTTNKVEDNDVIVLTGDFSDKIFKVDKPGVTLTSDGTGTITNTQIEVTEDADNATVSDLKIVSTGYDYAIITSGIGTKILNNNITVTNNEGITRGIGVEGLDVIVEGNTVFVSGPALMINWMSETPVANTMGIYVNNAENVLVENNKVTVVKGENATIEPYGTTDAIELRESLNVTVINNRINITSHEGAKGTFFYALNALSNLENITIANNTIYSSGVRYANGIQVGNGFTNSIIENNTLNIVCFNTTELTGDDEAMAYGIISSEMGGTGTGVTYVSINNNKININSTIVYAIELFDTEKNNITNNIININGTYSAMGMAIDRSPEIIISNNTINAYGNSSLSVNNVVEHIPPYTVGIQSQDGSDYVVITNNKINIVDYGEGYPSRRGIPEELTTVYICEVKNNNVTNNTLDANNPTTGFKVSGDNAVAVESSDLTQNIVVKDNIGADFKEKAVIVIEVPEKIETGAVTTFKAIVTDINGNLINGKAVFKINGITFTDMNTHSKIVKVINGKTNITTELKGLKALNTIHNLTVVFSNSSYDRTENTTQITIDRVGVQLEKVTYTSYAGTSIKLNQTIKDVNGNPLYGSSKVCVKINGMTIANFRITNGILNQTIDLPDNIGSGTHTLTIIIGENVRYTTGTVNDTIVLKKQGVNVTINNITATPGEQVQLVATLVTNETNEAVTSGSYIFKINGKTIPFEDEYGEQYYETRKVTDGTAVCLYSILPWAKDGVYDITLSYSGNNILSGVKYTAKALTVKAL